MEDTVKKYFVFGSRGEIRTLTVHVLSVLPLPIGLLDHNNALQPDYKTLPVTIRDTRS